MEARHAQRGQESPRYPCDLGSSPRQILAGAGPAATSAVCIGAMIMHAQYMSFHVVCSLW